MAKEQNARGRPSYNIFSESKTPPKKPTTFRRSLSIQSLIIDVRQRAWRRRYPVNFATSEPVAWSNAINEGDDNRVAFSHAERAMLLCGRKFPEKRYDKEGVPVKNPTYYDLFFWFRMFCRDVMNGNSKTGVKWNGRGQKPDAEKIYRTAVCVLTARRFIQHSGGDRWFVPKPVAVSQVWEVLFGEKEDKDSIRKRMQTVAWFCRKFGKENRLSSYESCNSIYKLAKPISRIYKGNLEEKPKGSAKASSSDEFDALLDDGFMAAILLSSVDNEGGDRGSARFDPLIFPEEWDDLRRRPTHRRNSSDPRVEALKRRFESVMKGVSPAGAGTGD